MTGYIAPQFVAKHSTSLVLKEKKGLSLSGMLFLLRMPSVHEDIVVVVVEAISRDMLLFQLSLR
jgi:hypothetical protein